MNYLQNDDVSADVKLLLRWWSMIQLKYAELTMQMSYEC